MTKIPYSGTVIAPEKTQSEIIILLYKHGAEATRWTSEKDGKNTLEFIFSVKSRQIAFRVTPPIMKNSRGEPLTAQCMRLLYWWLKSQLEAIQYGLVSIEEAFLANVAGSLPSGETVTLGDLLLPKLRSGEILGPADLQKALPSKTED